MNAFIAPLAVFLAAVFATSAIGKLRSPDRGRAAFTALQIPVRRPDVAAIALIVAESLVALGLVTTWGWVFVGFTGAAFVLTVGLLVTVVRAYRRGATDDCGCFGDWLPAAISPRLIARNVMLTTVAGGVLLPAVFLQTFTGASMGLPPAVTSAPASSTPAAYVVGALSAAALIAVTTWSIARVTPPVSATPALPSASAVSAVPGPSGRGAGAVIVPESSEVVDLLAPGVRARLVVFVSAGCHACETALAALRDAQDEVSRFVDIYVVQRAATGSTDVRSTHELPRAARFALDIGGSLGVILDTGPGTPVAALIGTDGTQAGPLANGSDETALLVDSIRSLADASPT